MQESCRLDTYRLCHLCFVIEATQTRQLSLILSLVIIKVILTRTYMASLLNYIIMYPCYLVTVTMVSHKHNMTLTCNYIYMPI